jgi:phosphoribosylformimino-5-aminoimidazole carboxamide ribonucleotide (ProFAR) isomerase
VFLVMPAIDVAGGRLAAFTQEAPRPVEAFGGDPVEAARAFAAAGATWIHVVDMDLALSGEARNVDVVTEIRRAAPGVLLQASGGITDPADAGRFVQAGAARVVLGSAALGAPRIVEDMLASARVPLIVGIDVAGGRIRSRGRDPVDLDLMSTLGWLVAAGVSGFVLTAVGRVGGSAGPDLAAVRRVARAGRPVLAAGGIRSIEHLRDVRRAGAAGAVVGRAAVTGTMDLRAALQTESDGRRVEAVRPWGFSRPNLGGRLH